MNRSIPIFQMHIRDKFSWYYLPLIIIGSSFVINFIISYFLTEPLYTGGLASVFVYMFVMGVLLVPQTFQFLLGMSITRKEYYGGTLLASLAVSIISSAVLVGVGALEKASNYWGTNLHFFHLPFLNDGSVAVQFLVYLMIFLFLFTWGFLIASFFRRFGSKSMILSFLISIVSLTIISFLLQQFNWWGEIFSWLTNQTALSLSLWTLPFTLFFAVISYFLLRRSSV